MELVAHRAIVVVAVAGHTMVELAVHMAVLDSRSLVRNQQDCMPLSRVELVVWRHLLDNWIHVPGKDRHIRQKFFGLMEDSRWRLSHSRQAPEVSLARLSFQPALHLRQLQQHEKIPFSDRDQVSLQWVKLVRQLSRMFAPRLQKLQESSLEVVAVAVGHLGHKNTSDPVVAVLVL